MHGYLVLHNAFEHGTQLKIYQVQNVVVYRLHEVGIYSSRVNNSFQLYIFYITSFNYYPVATHSLFQS